LALAGLVGIATVLVGATMLLHVILAGEGLVALGTEGVLLARVLLGVSRRMAGSGEEIVAVELLR